MIVDRDTGDEHVHRDSDYDEACCMCGRTFHVAERVWITPSRPRSDLSLMFTASPEQLAAADWKGETLVTCRVGACIDKAREFARAQHRGDRLYRAHQVAMAARRREWEASR